ncbi:hypothetical protein BG46_17085 [Brucella anthropi]|uniref:hypothetical protein n=1 Tax=Brucella anthropi TaxID=529 RepID=UPI000452E2C0|nr:hypothetical protein [Brucella anthropi]EXL06469.1 hypothetical protein BG46_17085 [Brucella anthropi]
METTAILYPDGKSFKMTRGAWSSDYPISDLSKWLAFYRLQQELFPAHAGQYAHDVAALDRLAASIGTR